MVGLLLVVLGGLQTGCTPMTPEQRLATEKAWAERDRERSEECMQFGGRYFAGTCLYGTAR
jgi:hypothetical protein